MKRVFLCAVVCLLLIHCGSATDPVGNAAAPSSSASVTLQFTNPFPSASEAGKSLSVDKTVIKANLSSCTVTVSAADMTTVTKTFDVSSSASTISTSVNVPLGSNRTFAISCSDGSATTNNIIVGYAGSTTSDLTNSTTSISLTPQFQNLVSGSGSVLNYARLNQTNSTQTQLIIGFQSALTVAQQAAMQVIVELDTAGTRTGLGTIDSSQSNGFVSGTKATPYLIVNGGTAAPSGFLYDANGNKTMKLSCAWGTNSSSNTEITCTFGITQMKNNISSNERGQFAAIGSLTGASPWEAIPSGSKYAKYDLSPNTNTSDVASLSANGSACTSGQTCSSGFCGTSSVCVAAAPKTLSGTVSDFVGPAAGCYSTCPSGSTDATGTSARFSSPAGICMASDGTKMYVADCGNNKIRQIALPGGVTTTLAGSGAVGTTDGTGTSATFSCPIGCVIDATGANLYISDTNSNLIRKIVLSTVAVTTIAGTGSAGSSNGTGTLASFNNPNALAIDHKSENLYISDSSNKLIRKMVLSSGAVTTFAGSGTAGSTDGIGTAASFNTSNFAMAIDSSDTNLYLPEAANRKIRKIVIATQTVSTLAGSGDNTSTDGIGTLASSPNPHAIAIDPTDSFLYFADLSPGRIRKLEIATRAVTTITGASSEGDTNGTGANATFYRPVFIAIDPTGTSLFIVDRFNNKIRQIQ